MSGLDIHAEGTGRYTALSREDSHQIQIIMNVVLRALTNLGKETPIPLLLRSSGFLSFHQMCAHSTLKTTHKILSTKEPVELFQAISNSRPSADRTRRHESSQTHYKLSISSLPENLQAIDKPEEFKKKSKAWVASNISIYM